LINKEKAGWGKTPRMLARKELISEGVKFMYAAILLFVDARRNSMF